MTWIALHHHRGRLEDRHGDLCHRELLVVGLLRRDDRSIGGQHEVDARIRHQICLEPCWVLIPCFSSVFFPCLCVTACCSKKNTSKSKALSDVNVQGAIETWLFHGASTHCLATRDKSTLQI